MSNNVIWGSMARLIDFSFSELESYVPTMQIALKREKEHFEMWVKKEMVGMDDDKADEFGELYSLDFEQMSATFPEISRRSSFLTIYSTLELSLMTLCWRVQKIEKGAFGPQDLKGEFNGAEAYLKRLGKINLKKCANWAKIEEYRQLRNLIVHQAGNVRKGDEKGRKLVARAKGVTIENENMICISDGYNLEAIEKMRDFIRDVVNQLRKTFP